MTSDNNKRQMEMLRYLMIWQIENFERHFELLWPIIKNINSDAIRAVIMSSGQDFDVVKKGCLQRLYRVAVQYNLIAAENCRGYDPELWQRNYACWNKTFLEIKRVYTHPKPKTHRMAVRRCVQNSVEKVFACKLDGEQEFCIRKDGYDIETCFDDHRSTVDLSLSHFIRTFDGPKVSIHSSALLWIGLAAQIDWEVAETQQELELMVGQAIELSQMFLNEYPWGLADSIPSI